MRLVDLNPRWLTDTLFVFQCPHCISSGKEQPRYLSVKTLAMSTKDQWYLFQQSMDAHIVVPSRPDFAWNISGREFESLTVSPSVDASPSGDWHGHITNGNILTV